MEFKKYKYPGKTCSSCKVYKLKEEYNLHKRDGIQAVCKECKWTPKIKQERTENKEARNAQRRRNYNTNEETKKKDRERNIKWRSENLEIARKCSDTYKKNNKEKVKQQVKKYINEKRQNDPFFRALSNIRSRTRNIFKNKKIQKNNTIIQHIGCSLEELREHIESQFQPGMTWENHGIFGWHVDHITPISKATTEEEIFKLCHYTNLQPLWAIDNLKKSNK